MVTSSVTVPDRATVRRALNALLVSDADFRAFCLDYFPDIERRFGGEMDRVTKENLLLTLAPTEGLYTRLCEIDRHGLLQPPAIEVGANQPAPVAAPEQLPRLQPPRASFDARWFVARPYEQQRAEDELTFHKPVVLYAPELYGKTWLLQMLLQSARHPTTSGGASRDRVASINLRLIDQTARSGLNTFLLKLASRLCKELQIQIPDLDRRFVDSRGGPIDALNDLLLYDILPLVSGRLILALDNVDIIAGQAYQDEFFGLLRAWTDSAEDEFQRLHLLLGVSTAPALLVQQATRSPFNVSDAILLGDLDSRQLSELAALHSLSLTSKDLDALHALVAGHPYLARLGMYEARRRSKTLAVLMTESATDPRGGIYSGYLDHLRSMLQSQPPLQEAVNQIVRTPNVSLQDSVAQRLERGGLVKRADVRREAGTATIGYQLRLPLYRLLVS